MFEYYYRDGKLINFVVAYIPEVATDIDYLRTDWIRVKPLEIQGVCGFIKTGSSANPDVFISYILTKKGSHFGHAFKMIEKIQELTNARTLACNNIRKKTRGIYDFLNYTVDDMTHWYRLNDGMDEYKLCSIPFMRHEPLRSEDIPAVEVTSVSQLDDFPFSIYLENRPYKDRDYVEKRYFNYPWHTYRVFRLSKGAETALLVIREIEWEGSKMLRVVDFVGDRSLIKDSGKVIDGIIKTCNAEFADWYAFGVPDEDMQKAGFSIRYHDDKNIIPLYYSPLLKSNVDITVFTNNPDNYMLFRADGDQDRPNLD